MNWFNDLPTVYLHRAPVDFRKAVNGLSEVVENELLMNPFDDCFNGPPLVVWNIISFKTMLKNIYVATSNNPLLTLATDY